MLSRGDVVVGGRERGLGSLGLGERGRNDRAQGQEVEERGSVRRHCCVFIERLFW